MQNILARNTTSLANFANLNKSKDSVLLQKHKPKPIFWISAHRQQPIGTLGDRFGVGDAWVRLNTDQTMLNKLLLTNTTMSNDRYTSHSSVMQADGKP